MSLVRFSDVLGHRAQVDILRRICGAAQPAHAYLFHGPEGVGKRTVARALVARLACLKAEGNQDACGDCRSCRALARGEHPDLTVVEPDGASIRIAQVRDALKRVRYEPVVATSKAWIFVDADRLREEAANALLKTLEEPPSRTHFVLVTSRPQLVLGTIVSRCQGVRFSGLAPDVLAELLVREGHAQQDARIAATLADGSLTRGRALCDASWLEAVDLLAQYVLTLDARPAADAAEMVEALGARWSRLSTPQHPDGDNGVAERSGAKARSTGKRRKSKKKDKNKGASGRLDREGLAWVLDMMRAILRDVMMVSSGCDPMSLPHSRFSEQLSAMAERVDIIRLIEVIESCQALEVDMVYNPNPRLALESLLVQSTARLTTA